MVTSCPYVHITILPHMTPCDINARNVKYHETIAVLMVKIILDR